MKASQATDITDQNNLQMQVSVYPNPAADYITITNIPNGSTIKITDITGRTFYSAENNNEKATISTTKFVNGVYFIQVANSSLIATRKFVVNH